MLRHQKEFEAAAGRSWLSHPQHALEYNEELQQVVREFARQSSPQKVEVLWRTLRGESGLEMVQALGISPSTVRKHRKSMRIWITRRFRVA